MESENTSADTNTHKSVFDYLGKMADFKASDLYITDGLPATWRDDEIVAQGDAPHRQEEIVSMIKEMISEDDYELLLREKELNIAVDKYPLGRFRVNFFMQRQKLGFVVRRIEEKIPSLEDLNLPEVYKEAIEMQNGLVLLVGATGSGKTTSIASMLEYRNQNRGGHVITVEDPVEFSFENKKCIFTQREIGLDTNSWENALKNALRQRPDVIYIGEIRDKETMIHAMNYAETGHLCIATLHSNSASQAVERVASFFWAGEQQKYLYSLSHVLKFILGQRLLPSAAGNRREVAVEVLKNIGLIRPLICEGNIAGISETIAKHKDIGMGTFDQAILDLLDQSKISQEVAVRYSDSPDNMRLELMKKQGSFNNVNNIADNNDAAL